MRILYLLRGLPGAGKTTLAKLLGGDHFEADMYFDHPIRGYEFDASLLPKAHAWCKSSVENRMSNCAANNKDSVIVVSNTFTTDWELEGYYIIARMFGYRVYTIVVENRHEGTSVHNVPADTIEKMRNRFQIKL